MWECPRCGKINDGKHEICEKCKKMKIIISEVMPLRLVLIQESDLEKIKNWRMLPEVTNYMYTDPKLTMNNQLQWFTDINNNPAVKYWIIEYNSTKIGVLNLSDIDNTNKRCKWAYYIADNSYRGKGIGKTLECNIYDYVFYKLNLNKLVGEVFDWNEKVIALHKNFGSKIEGTFKNHILKNGEFNNVVSMAILKNEWSKLRNKHTYYEIDIE